MKVAMLCPTGVPPVTGGAERLWLGIVQAINQLTDHIAELVNIAAPEATFADLVESYGRFSHLDLDHFDMVITGKYPAWMVRHPRHVVYMCHPLRGLYDTYPIWLPTTPSPTTAAAERLADSLYHLPPGARGARDRVLRDAGALLTTVAPDHPDIAFPGPLARLTVRWLDRDALDARNICRSLAISRTRFGSIDAFTSAIRCSDSPPARSDASQFWAV